VPQGRGYIAAINLVLLHLEDDLAHGGNLGGGKLPRGMAVEEYLFERFRQ